MKRRSYYLFIAGMLAFFACRKNDSPPPVTPPAPGSFGFNGLLVNGVYNGFVYYNVNTRPVIKISFSAAIDHGSVAANISFKDKAGTAVAFTPGFDNHDSALVITPAAALQAI